MKRLIPSLVLAIVLLIGIILPVSGQTTGLIQFALGGDRLNFLSGAVVDVQDGALLYSSDGNLTIGDSATITDDLTVTDIVTATSLGLNGIRVSGPIVFGVATSITDGKLVAHGLGTTPTAVIVSPNALTAAVGTITATYFSIRIGGGVAPSAVYWMAGK